jgi:hypothetical protein
MYITESTAPASKKKKRKKEKATGRRQTQDDFELGNSDGYHGHGGESLTPYFNPKYNLKNDVRIKTERESPTDDNHDFMSVPAIATPSISGSPLPSSSRLQLFMSGGLGPPSNIGTKSRLSMIEPHGDHVINGLHLQVEVAEAELKAARLRLRLALQQRGAEVAEGMGTKDEPHVLE